MTYVLLAVLILCAVVPYAYYRREKRLLLRDLAAFKRDLVAFKKEIER